MLARRLLVAGGGGSFTSPTSGTGILTVDTPTVVTNDSKYNAWPIIARLATGDLILVYTKGDSHHGDNTGKAVGRISADEGATWGSEATVYDHVSLWASAMGVFVSSSGRVLVTLWRDNWNSAGTGEAGLVYSDDNGANWSAWIDLTNGFTQEAYGAGPCVELANGDLLVTIEGSNTGQSIANRSCHTLRSTDDGATWGSEVTVRNYVTDTRPYYESKLLLLPNADLLCIHRTSGGTGTHYISLSTDDGATWGAPSSEFTGYGAPSTIRATTGTLVAITRQNSDAATIAYTSLDDGVTWGSAQVIDGTMYEMEYGAAVQLLDGRLLVVYGYQPTSSTTNSDIYQAYVTEGT